MQSNAGSHDKYRKGTITHTPRALRTCLRLFLGEGGHFTLSPKSIKSAAKVGVVQKGHRKTMENYKLSQKTGADRRREEREMGRWTWSDVGFEDGEKLIVGIESGEEHTQSHSPSSL